MVNLKNKLLTSRLTLASLKLRRSGLNATKGFTLIELMVAIAIVAVLATIGFTLFQNTQAQARDAKRKQDIDSMATVLEQKFNATSGTYTAIIGADFTTQVPPTDPLSSGAYNYSGAPVTGESVYIICAKLESPTGNSSNTAGLAATNGDFYCRRNQQQ